MTRVKDVEHRFLALAVVPLPAIRPCVLARGFPVSQAALGLFLRLPEEAQQPVVVTHPALDAKLPEARRAVLVRPSSPRTAVSHGSTSHLSCTFGKSQPHEPGGSGVDAGPLPEW